MNYDNNNSNKYNFMVLFGFVTDIVDFINNFYQLQLFLQIITLIIVFVIYLYSKTN